MAKRSFWLATAVVLTSQALFVAPSHGEDRTRLERDPQRKTIKVSVMNGPPWSMKDEDGHWRGITIDLLREIGEEMHVNFDFKEYDLDGVQKAVQNREVDLSGAGLAITAEREARYDFSDPYFVFNQSVAVNADQEPSVLETVRVALLSWGFLKIVLLLVGITIIGGAALWLLEQRGDSEHYSQKDSKAFTRSLFWSLIVLSGRDMPHHLGWEAHAPKTRAARFFAVGWMLIGLLLFSLITAGAASFLTSKQLKAIVNSRDDLRHVRCGTVIGSAAAAYMDRHNIKYRTYESPIALLSALVAHKIDAAVYGSTTLAYYAGTQFTNKVVVLNFSLRHDFAALALQPGSPLRKQVNEAILHTLESTRWQTIVAKYITTE